MKNVYRVLFLLVFVSACAPPSIKTSMIVPATYHEASKIKEIAVLPFEGPMGSETTSQIESVLAQADVGGKSYFTVVDRIKLKNIIEGELKLSMSALVNPDTAVKVGRLVGAKGIYTGVVTSANTHDERYTEKRTKCLEYKKRDKPKWYESKEVCVRDTEDKVNCVKRTAIFSFTPKLIEVESGRIVFSQNISGNAESKTCSDKSDTLKSPAELIREASFSAFNTFKKSVIPQSVSVDIEMMEPDDGIRSKDAVSKIEQGAEFAKNNRLDRACELWSEAKALSPDSPSILYNLGICAEVTGNLGQALDLYRKADKLLLKPDDKVNGALNRVQKRIDDQTKLK